MNLEINNGTVQNTKNSASEICFRCPHCHKLYKTTSDVFDGADPDFDCIACSKSFKLLQHRNSAGLFVAKEISSKSFDSCPKCSFLKPNQSDECPSCGVLASKYIEIQKVESPSLFELNQKWQKVLQNFDQDKYHQDFINMCQLKTALNFAHQKYSGLQKTMGYDSVCDTYLRQIELRIEQQFKNKETVDLQMSSARDLTQKLTSRQYIFIGLGTLGMLLLIYNKHIPTFPNINGFVLFATLFAFSVGIFANGHSIKS